MEMEMVCMSLGSALKGRRHDFFLSLSFRLVDVSITTGASQNSQIIPKAPMG